MGGAEYAAVPEGGKMSLSEYTVPLDDGMVVKHGSQARLRIKSGNTVLQDELTDVRYLGGAIAQAGIVYNRLCMSGGTSWWNPSTGKSIRKPKYEVLLRPEDIRSAEEIAAYKADPEGWQES
jgi:hypothetical protein